MAVAGPTHASCDDVGDIWVSLIVGQLHLDSCGIDLCMHARLHHTLLMQRVLKLRDGLRRVLASDRHAAHARVSGVNIVVCPVKHCGCPRCAGNSTSDNGEHLVFSIKRIIKHRCVLKLSGAGHMVIPNNTPRMVGSL
jgi:hypothetical protein